MLCAYMRSRYQVSIYRNIGPLVLGTARQSVFIFRVILPHGALA